MKNQEQSSLKSSEEKQTLEIMQFSGKSLLNKKKSII